MPGQSLGGASYELIVNNEQLLKGFAESQAQAKINAKKIADAVDDAQRKIEGRQSRGAEMAAAAARKAADAQIRESKRAADGAIREADRAAKAQQAAAAKAEAAAKKAAAGSGRAGGKNDLFQFAAVAGGASALGAGGLIVSATALHDVIVGTISATAALEKAQRAVNVLYGAGAEAVTDFAKAQAAANPTQTTAAYLQAAAAVKTLSANYGLSAAQLQQVIKLGADYAAISGMDVVDATKRISDAIRGEAEAAEALGLTLNSDAVKAMAAMTDEQRKNWETLDPLVKAQIILKEALKQGAEVSGEATKSSGDLTGSFGALGKSATSLGEALGQQATPALAGFVDGVTRGVDRVRELIEGTSGLQKAMNDIQVQINANPALSALHQKPETMPGGAGPQFGPSPEEVKRVKAAMLAISDAEAAALVKRTDAEKIALDAHLTRQKQGAALALEFIEGRKDAVTEAAAAEKQIIGDTRDRDIAASRAAMEADLDALDARSRASAAHFQQAIANAEAARDAQIAGIEQRQQQIETARTGEDRALQDTRTREDRASAKAAAAVQQRFAARTAAVRSAGAAQIAQIEAGADADRKAAEQAIRGIEAQADAARSAAQVAIRAIDSQIAAERSRAAAAIRGIDQQLAAENRRHDQAIANIDAEAAAQLGEIDDRLAALDARELALSRAREDADQQQALRDAKTGRERAEALRRIAETKVDRKFEDERAGLQAQRQAIQEEAAARKQAENERHQAATEALNARKQELQDELAARVEALEAEKVAIADGLAARLEVLEIEKVAVQDGLALRLEGIEAEKELIAERIEAQLAGIELQKEAAAAAAEAAAQAREDERQAEERALADKRRAEDLAFEEEKRAINAAADAQIAALKAQADAEAQFFADQKEMVRDAAEAEQNTIKSTSEMLERELDKRTKATIRELDEQERKWKDFLDRVTRQVEQAKLHMHDFFEGKILVEHFHSTGGATMMNQYGGVGPAPYGPPAPPGRWSVSYYGGGPPPITFAQSKRSFFPSQAEAEAEVRRLQSIGYIGTISSFEKGTDYVPKTGPAMLHKGERVIPAEVNRQIMREPTLISSAPSWGRGARMDGGPMNGGGAVRFGDINIEVNGVNKNARQIAAEIGPLVLDQVVDMLDRTQLRAPNRVNRVLPGAI